MAFQTPEKQFTKPQVKIANSKETSPYRNGEAVSHAGTRLSQPDRSVVGKHRTPVSLTPGARDGREEWGRHGKDDTTKAWDLIYKDTK